MPSPSRRFSQSAWCRSWLPSILPIGPLGKVQVLILTFYTYIVGMDNPYEVAPWRAVDVLLGGAAAIVLALVWPSRMPLRHLLSAGEQLGSQIRTALLTTATGLAGSSGTRLEMEEHHAFRAAGDALVGGVRAGDLAAAQGRESAVWNWRAPRQMQELERLEARWAWLGQVQAPLRVLIRVIDDLYDHRDRHPPLLARQTLISLMDDMRSVFDVAFGPGGTREPGNASAQFSEGLQIAEQNVLQAAPTAHLTDPMVISSLGLIDHLQIVEAQITRAPS